MSSTVLSVFGNIAPLALGLIVAVFVTAAPIVIDTAKSNWRKQFRRQIKNAVVRQTLTFPDLQHLAERWNQDRQAVLQSLRILLAEALSGDDPDAEKHADDVRKLLLSHEAREPYAELPENISLQLASLVQTSPQRSMEVAQLAASLSELYSANQRDAARQKKLSFWGFVVGIIGLLLSIPGLYITFKT